MRRAIRFIWMAAAIAAMASSEEERGASLGVESRRPTAEEGNAFSLGAIAGRWRGRLVTSVEEKGPADLAGIRAGDVLIRVGDNDLYSQDDLDDVLRVASAGKEVALLVKRAGTHEEETPTVTLAPPAELPEGGFRWDFAGPGQLDEALALAKKEGKRVVVGLSGAET